LRPCLPGRAACGDDDRGLGRDPFRSRLRTAPLRDLYDRWRSLRSDGPLPPLGRFDPGPLGASGQLLAVEVDRTQEPVSFRFLSVGSTLTTRLGRPLSGERVPVAGEEVMGALEGAYRRCVRTSAPSYEYARFDLDDGGPVLFERLLLPFSADGHAPDGPCRVRRASRGRMSEHPA
jgi:hypothetical protein